MKGITTQEGRETLNKFKMEAANEVGVNLKSCYCDCAFEAFETGIVCRLFKHEVQRYILVRGVVNSGEIKGMLSFVCAIFLPSRFMHVTSRQRSSS